MRTFPNLFVPLALLACSDYGLQPDLPDPGPGPEPAPKAPDVAVEPAWHDFGTLDLGATAEIPVTISNVGEAPLTVSGLEYRVQGDELTLDVDEATNGALPWTLDPGESREVRVAYVPVDEHVDDGELIVRSDDPADPEAVAQQIGAARPFSFSTGWYIVDDPTVYETVSDPAHVVDQVGDPDGYWYEPSGVHGLVDSVDPVGDFAVLRQWILDRAGAPTPVTGPLSFQGASVVPDLEGASYTWILCDFWLDWNDDPSRYAIVSGMVDDGIRVMVNGQVLGELQYGQSGSWPLANAIPGQVNSLVVVLQDNAEVEKYLFDLAFLRDGVMVAGS